LHTRSGLLSRLPQQARELGRRADHGPDARDRVTGVRVLHSAADGGSGSGARSEETLQADLVVATGRTGRAAAWLPALGYAAAAEEQVKVQIKYLSRALRLRPGALGGKKQVIVGSSPGCLRGLGILAVESDRWILTVFGYNAPRRAPSSCPALPSRP
jgi:hypothetical protein